jgi:capsular polysaccharide transport system permease protein
MRGLQKSIDLRGAFGRGDILRGFPGLDWDDSEENLHRYYQGMVEAQVDSMSPIVVLTVRAFTAVDALGINERLLEQGEALVNQLNERARLDMIRFAQDEADIAETRAKRAAIALAQFRNERGVIDPERQTTISFQQIAKLQEELIAARTQLTQLQMMARDNPQVSPLIKRVQSLEDEITRESARVTGGGKSLASKASEFQRLALEKEFAEKQLTVALASLEQARNEAHRKQLYLERIAQPNLPDVAMEPKRLRAFFATMVMALITWGVVSMVVAGVKEHAN